MSGAALAVVGKFAIVAVVALVSTAASWAVGGWAFSVGKTGRVPYNHVRNRQCSIGYHDECTDPNGQRCKCPCHRRVNLRPKKYRA